MEDKYFGLIPGKAQREHSKLLAEFLKHSAIVSEIKIHKQVLTRTYLEAVAAILKDENSSRAQNSNTSAVTRYMKKIHDHEGDSERHILRKNLYFLAKKTKHLGLVLTQLTWSGLLNVEDKRNIMSHVDDIIRAIDMYATLFKKDTWPLAKLLTVLHTTGNHEVALSLDPKTQAKLLRSEKMRSIICKKEEPTRKSKDENISSISNSLNISSFTSFFSPKKSNEKHKGIPIERGMEDKRSCVVLCKCGNYHQLPKWKQVSHSTKVPDQRKMSKKKAILHPIVEQVEIAQDSLRGDFLPATSSSTPKTPKFTKSRKSCQYFKLRFHGSCKTEDADGSNVPRLKHSPSMRKRVML